MTRTLRRVVTYAWLPAGLVTLWWLVSSGSDSLYFPPLPDILSAVRELWIFEHTLTDLLPSLRNMLLGFLLAVAVGTLAGLLIGSAPRLCDALEPILEFARAMPAVAFLPIAILVLGLDEGMRIAVIAFGAVWPVLINTVAAVRGIDPSIRDLEAAYGISAANRLFRVRLGVALPQIIAGARVSLYVSIALIVVSEMQGSAHGIGHFVLTSQRTWAVVDMWSGMVVLGVTGYVLSVLFRAAERALLRGYPATTTRQRGA
ncbi:ABC transporter permease [Jiangella alkaliphila]|uniref:ABC-type nitrate/sulfonate/bicarbonate transport system, permease component n=1 Tax=Jiangella alkaliphila TaxID=419479 RepID=A0A1H2LEC8_9ACTN|nr:ABC transporter permease [Jiangella alkaliphila]SDU79085.1 ABC-type nitrate/sulfonate/bicarbonate transport system, permease component [Jiangella alkaliphila]